MELSPLENYLASLAQSLEGLAPHFARPAEAGLTLDELIHRDFEQVAAEQLGKLAASMDQLAEVHDQIDAIAELNWLKRRTRRTEFQSLQRSQCALEEALHVARSRLFLAERKHHTDPVAFARIKQHYEDLGHQQEQRHQFEQLRQVTADIQHQILQSQLIYGRENVALGLPSSAPAFQGLGSIERVLAFLRQLHHFLPTVLKRDATNLAGIHDAQQILDCLRTSERENEAALPDDDAASAHALADLLVPAATVEADQRYHDLQRLAVQPTMFRQLESWLVYWTCLAWYRPGVSGTATEALPLSARVDAWCDAWREQSSRWSPGTLQRFAAGFEAVPCAHFRLNAQGVNEAPHDVLFLLTVAAHERVYCRIAGVHFQSTGTQGRTDVSVVEQDQIPSTVAYLHRRSLGRWRGSAAVWSSKSHAMLHAFDYRHAETTSSTPPDQMCAEPIALATALTMCLTASQGNAFETIDDAFYWLSEGAILPLPRNLMVMSIGRSADVMRDVPDLVQRFGQRFGGTYAQVLCCNADTPTMVAQSETQEIPETSR